MKNIALKRLKVIALPKKSDGLAFLDVTHSGSVATVMGVTPKIKLGFLAELAAMGYRVTNPELLDKCSEAALVMDHQTIVQSLKAMRGGDVDYVPLFQGFPNDVPEENEYFIKRIIGFLSQYIGLDTEHLFNKEEFGADPITQFQTEELYKAGVQRQKDRDSDDTTVWIDLEIQFLEDASYSLCQFMNRCLTAKSSIKETLHKDLRSLIKMYSGVIDMSDITIKENLVLVLETLWEDPDRAGNLVSCLKTPVDVLRLLAALTDSDVSLATPIKFPKLRRDKRRLILNALEHASSLEEDLLRHEGLWIKVAEYLHPGEHARKFPKTAAAFDKLRNGKIVSFNGQVQALMDAGSFHQASELLSERPGLFARRLHELLVKQTGGSDALIQFEAVCDRVPVKTLFTLRAYFRTINDLENRTIVNKKGAIKIVENTSRGKLSKGMISRVVTGLETVIHDRLGTLEPLGKCWIDPTLAQYVVPFQQRKGSDGLVAIPRGSKFDIAESKVLRLFNYWKQDSQRTDLDLSLVQYDENWLCTGHVSYTRLKDKGIVHSGDIQSAPHGAVEFIDISYDALPKEVRYLAMQINKYSGENFGDCERCHCGWMARDKVSSSTKSFDIKTVQNLLNISGSGRQALPLVVDVKERKAVYVDLYKAAGAYTRVENTLAAVTTIIQEISRFTETRPNLLDLVTLNAQARGEIVEDREDADVTFGITGCDYNASDLEAILAELIA